MDLTIYFVDINKDIVDEFTKKFKDIPNVFVVHESVTNHKEIADFDAIISPANSYGYMRGGIDGVYSSMFPEVEERVQRVISKQGFGEKRKYIPIGGALVTKTGSKEIPYIISAPTMNRPGTFIGETSNAYLAFDAALRVIKKFNSTKQKKIKTIFCPAFGTGVGGISAESAVEQMFRAYKENE